MGSHGSSGSGFVKTYILSLAVTFSLVVGSSLEAAVAYDRINVTAYNAVPNDANSDTAAIMAAVNHPYQEGAYAPTKSIYFPAGTYIFDGSSPLTLPSNTSFRLYGEGPGVSTIIFMGSNPGISAPNVGLKTLQIEGLTLLNNTSFANVGTAISATFSPTQKAKSATIRNVQIRGTDLTPNPAKYWRYGIYLNGASNAVIEDVQIHGAYTGSTPFPDDAIHWHAPVVAPPQSSGATQLFVKNLYASFYKTGVRTSGHVEGLYMSGFELVFCGSQSTGAMEITGQVDTNGAAVPAFHIMNGHINQLYNGIRMSNLVSVKISHVNFYNIFGLGNHIALTNVVGASITENGFGDHDCAPSPPGPPCTPITTGNGIYLLGNTDGTRIAGNLFGLNNQGGGDCIVVESGCQKTSILDNDFGDSAHRINNMAGSDTVIRNIFP